jgi:hypothetical protein
MRTPLPTWIRTRTPIWRSLAALVVLVPAATALAAGVSGKLVLGAYKPEPPKQARAAYNWELENGFKEVLPDRIDAERELAVVLVGKNDAPPPEKVAVRLYGGSLLPATVVVPAGSTVEVRNDDEFAHALYAEGLEGFGAEPTSPRALRAVNLPKAGSWPVRDKLIPHVRAHLHVVADLAAIAKVQRNGSFAFEEVPAGTYTLKVFHGATELVSQAVEVGGSALVIDPITLTRPEAD